MSVAAIYPGSFDPVTNGHIDIIRRCRRIFSRVVVAVLHNPRKRAMFTLQDRRDMLEELLAADEGIEVTTFDGLLVEVARARQTRVIIRGLRAISDFEYEFQMAMMNRHLESRVETLFMVPDQAYTYTSSSLIKEIYQLGGSVSAMVPAIVEARLQAWSEGDGE